MGLRAADGYPPFQRFKSRLTAGLPLDFLRLSTPCREGLVSVVLPVFNGEKFVAESIASVLGQTRAALELIVVDDGSTDGTPPILDRFRRDPRLRVVRQNNRKLPSALNAGFACARGEYYTWISADNRMSPTMLATLVEYLEANAGVQMVYADEELIGETGEPLRNRRFYWDYQTPRGSGAVHLPHDTGELNYNHNNYIGACFLYRAWAAKILGAYDPACFGFEDYDYWLRMNTLFRVAHRGVPGPLYQYRLHPASLTSRAAELRILHRSREHLSLEKKRRQFFLEPFDITFAGHHPYFGSLARAYRARGHNVHTMTAGPDMYLYQITRAFRKAVLITAGSADPASFATGQTIFHAIAEDDRLRLPSAWLSAPSAEALAYPLLAAANSALRRLASSPERF